MTLSSCRSSQIKWACKQVEKYEVVERCSYSSEFDKCRCHQYNLSTGERISEAVDYESEYCDDVIGFKFKDWKIELTPKIKSNYELYDDYCN
jgi:hypothetical protein